MDIEVLDGGIMQRLHETQSENKVIDGAEKDVTEEEKQKKKQKKKQAKKKIKEK